MNQILVPVDFSEVSFKALRFAESIADDGDTILLLNVVDVPAIGMAEPYYASADTMTGILNDLINSAEEKLKEAEKNITKNLNIKRIVEVGSPFDGIQKHLNNEHADLIVMGTQGASGLKEIFVGSNTEKAVRFSKCPVIAIPSDYNFDTVEKILMPTDLKDLTDEVLSNVRKMQEFYSADLHFLWVHTPHLIENEKEVKEKITKLVKEHGLENFEVHIVRDVFPDIGILYYAQHIEADMIAMATHGRKGIAHLFTGSRAEDVVNHTTIPVWTFNLNK
ncbi:MAG: universal stress protein [Bacteroidota bacterium]